MTGIEWTDKTWNPLVGCTKVSAGCAHCYAEGLAKRFHWDFGKITLYPERLDKPKHWRKPRRIFVNSMSDLFHEKVPLEFIQKVFDAIADAPQHVYQILTKRHDRLVELANALPWHDNIWMGVSVENQDYVKRIDCLREVPTENRFLECVPLLGPLELDLTGIHWVIVGGESGPKRRPVNIEWVREIRDQCLATGVPFFFKQWGGANLSSLGRDLDGKIWLQMPPVMQRLVKSVATESSVVESEVKTQNSDEDKDVVEEIIARKQTQLEEFRQQLKSSVSSKTAKKLKKERDFLERDIRSLFAYLEISAGETVTKTKDGEIGTVTGKFLSPGKMPSIWVEWEDSHVPIPETLDFIEKVRWSGWDWIGEEDFSVEPRIVRFNLDNREQVQEISDRSFLIEQRKALSKEQPRLVDWLESATGPKKGGLEIRLSILERKLEYIEKRLATLPAVSSGDEPVSSCKLDNPIRIDPSFKSLGPPLSGKEYEQLELNLLSFGCLNPLILWKRYGILLDGHNRYEICTQLGIPFKTEEIELPDRDAALNWIISHQLGRRNLTPEAMSYLRGKQYNQLKQQGRRTDLTCGQNEHKLSETPTSCQSGTKLSEAPIFDPNGKSEDESTSCQSGQKWPDAPITDQNGKTPGELTCGQNEHKLSETPISDLNGKSSGELTCGQNEHKLKTATWLAEKHKTSTITIRRDAKFAKAVDVLAATVGLDVRSSILGRTANLTKKKTIELAAIARKEPQTVQEQFFGGQFIGYPLEKPPLRVFEIGEVVVVLKRSSYKMSPKLKGKAGYWGIVTGVSETLGLCSVDVWNCSVEVAHMEDLESLEYSQEECDRMRGFRDRLVRLSQVRPEETAYSILINLGKLKRPFTLEEVRLLEFLEGEYGLLAPSNDENFELTDIVENLRSTDDEELLEEVLEAIADFHTDLFHQVANRLAIYG